MRCARVSVSIRSTRKSCARNSRAVAPLVLPYMDSVWSLLDQKRREGKRILFEGAQGALLDVDHGTYPYVTSSNTVAAQAATGSGLGPGAIGYVLGHLQSLHHPGRRGSVSNRAEERDRTHARRTRQGIRRRHRTAAALRLVRRGTGAADRAHLRHRRPGARPSSISSTALTRSRCASAITLDGREIDYLPAGEHVQARVAPIYETIDGWREQTARRPVLGGVARAGHQIRAPDRGIDRLLGGRSVDQPGARGYDPDAQSVRRLNG